MDVSSLCVTKNKRGRGSKNCCVTFMNARFIKENNLLSLNLIEIDRKTPLKLLINSKMIDVIKNVACTS